MPLESIQEIIKAETEAALKVKRAREDFEKQIQTAEKEALEQQKKEIDKAKQKVQLLLKESFNHL